MPEDAPEGAVEALLRDAFHYLRCATLLMHPIVPRGCELIFEHLAIEPGRTARARRGTPGFFNWCHVFEPIDFWATDEERAAGSKVLEELPPRFDFFEKHPSQYEDMA